MSNEEWTNELENVIGSYLDDFMRNALHPETADASGNSQSTDESSSENERFTNRRYYTLLNEVIHEYNQNFRLYQQNMREIINHMRTIRPPNQPQNTQPAVTSALFSYILQPQGERPAQNVLNPEQISRAVETVAYNNTMSESRCPICLEDFFPGEQICKIVVCGHIFKRPGLMSWFARNNHCPVCRRDVVIVPEQQARQQPNRATNNRPHVRPNIFTNARTLANPLLNEIGGIFANMRNFPDLDLSYNGVD